jgi:hypothetical protein
MALGEFTKQIAQQALLSATTKEPPAPAAPGQPENLTATFFGQIHAMQKAVKDDEELAIQFGQGADKVRILELFAPSPQVVVLTGTDAERNLTRVISTVESLQLVLKVMKVQPGAKPLRVALIAPKPKS